MTDHEVGELARLIQRMSETALVLLVEHNMQLMYELADRVVALINGSVAADGTVAEVKDDPNFASAYLGLSAEGTRNSVQAKPSLGG